jgi:hypothetical protein
MMETPPLLPDDHADAALDGWQPFESRRVKADLNLWDVVGAVVAFAGALAAVWFVPL